MRLNHVHLIVADVAASRAFYARHLGVGEAVHEEPGFAILAPRGGGLLALHEGSGPAEPGGGFHFGFELGGADEVDAARHRFREEGLQEVAYQRDAGFAFVRVADPDGHHVEVYALMR